MPKTTRPTPAKLARLAKLHAQNSTSNLRWLAAHSDGWVRDLWLAAIEVQRVASVEGR